MLPIPLVFCIVLCCFPLVVFHGVHVAYLFNFLYCVGIFVFLFGVFVLFCFVCHRLVSCVASVASVSGLYIFDHLFRFALTFIRKKKKYNRKLSL